MKKIIILFLVVFTVTFFSCKKDHTDNQLAGNQTTGNQLTGLLQKQGVTSYQYGTHTLTTSSAIYALRSTIVNLDQYLNRTVTISGSRITGYPLEAGPVYIDVQTIK